jgi:hypothetical protein
MIDVTLLPLLLLTTPGQKWQVRSAGATYRQDWAVDVTDNPDNARTLACALIGNSLSDMHVLICRLHVFSMELYTRKRTNSNVVIMLLCYLITCFQCKEFIV